MSKLLWAICSTVGLVICGDTLFAQTAAVNTAAAVAALQQVQAANVQAGTTINDVTLYGTIIQDSGATEPVTIEIKGANKIRYEIGTGNTRRLTIYNENQGWTQVGKQKLTALQSYSSIRRPSVIPALDLISEFQNARLRITDQGVAAVGSQAVRHLTLVLPDTVKNRPFGRTFDETLEVYFDPQTKLVAATARVRYAEENMDMQIPTVMQFSDYRLIGTLQIPFQVITTTGNANIGTHHSTLIVSQARINTNIADSEFVPWAGGSR